MEKTCNGCGETKPLTEFHRATRRSGKVGARSRCKRCRSEGAGPRPPSDMQAIGIHFDEGTFAEIRAVATKERRSFAAIVRDLVEWGLMDLKEGQRS